MPAFNKFNSFVEALAEKKHDLGADTLKVMLTNIAPVATNSQKSDLTEISSGNGYTSGGTQANQSSSSQSSGVYKLVIGDVTFTASGGSIGPFRYAVLYNDTSTNDLLIGWWDYGSPFTLPSGDQFVVDFSSIDGVIQIS